MTTRGRVKGLTPAQTRSLRQNGYAVLPGAVPRPLIEAALADINCAVSEKNQSGATGSFKEEQWMDWRGTPEVMALLLETGLWELADALVGPIHPPAGPGFVCLRYPQRRRYPCEPAFHVDGVYSHDSWTRKGEIDSMSIKIAVFLSDVPGPDRGNFTVIPGSHLLLAEHLRERGLEALREGMPALSWGRPKQLVGRAGDAVVCHYMLVHEGEQNLSPHVRYAAFFNLMRDDHRAHQREALTDPWFEWRGLRRGLK